jgi:hypothetical protein
MLLCGLKVITALFALCHCVLMSNSGILNRCILAPFWLEMTTTHAHKGCLVTHSTLTTGLCDTYNVFYGGNWKLRLCNNGMCWIFLFWLQFIGYISPHNVTTMNQPHLTTTHIHSPLTFITCNQWLLSLLSIETMHVLKCSQYFDAE